MNRTTAVIGIGIILCAASVIWLEGRFTRSDQRKGKALVRSYQVEHRSERFEAFLVRKHGGAAGAWDASVSEGCRGVVRVQWTVAGNPPTIYAWDVEIPTQEIYVVPSSPGGKRMLEEFKATGSQLAPLELPPLEREGP